jgi:hypothetical protein
MKQFMNKILIASILLVLLGCGHGRRDSYNDSIDNVTKDIMRVNYLMDSLQRSMDSSHNAIRQQTDSILHSDDSVVDRLDRIDK